MESFIYRATSHKNIADVALAQHQTKLQIKHYSIPAFTRLPVINSAMVARSKLKNPVNRLHDALQAAEPTLDFTIGDIYSLPSLRSGIMTVFARPDSKSIQPIIEERQRLFTNLHIPGTVPVGVRMMVGSVVNESSVDSCIDSLWALLPTTIEFGQLDIQPTLPERTVNPKAFYQSLRPTHLQ